MKNLYLIVLVALGFNVVAQSSIALSYDKTFVPIAHNATLFANTSPGKKLTITLDIKNISSAQQSYDVKRYDMVLNKAADMTEAEAFFCFAGTCYDRFVFVSGDELVLEPGKSASDIGQLYFTLDADIIEATSIGLSVVKYTFLNINNAADSAQITIRYNDPKSGVGIRELAKNPAKFTVFPNPAKESTTVNVTANANGTATMRVFNSLGEVVIEKEVTLIEGKNNVAFNVSELVSGVYMMQLKDAAGSSSRKLIIE